MNTNSLFDVFQITKLFMCTLYMNHVRCAIKELPVFWKSTYPDDDQYTFYSTIYLVYWTKFTERYFPSEIRLYNLRLLCIKCPINDDDKFWGKCSKFKQINVSYNSNRCRYRSISTGKIYLIAHHIFVI